MSLWRRPRLEQLEDRTLLSFQNLGAGLNNIFSTLQQSLNGHLWPAGSFSLPMIANAAAPIGNFLSSMGSSLSGINPSSPSLVQSQIAGALSGSGATVTVTFATNQTDFQLAIANTFSMTTAAFATGLPGLDADATLGSLIKQAETGLHPLQVDINGSYIVTLFVKTDNNGCVILDTTHNTAGNPPLVSIMVTAGPHGGTLATGLSLGSFSVNVGLSGALTFAAGLNDMASSGSTYGAVAVSPCTNQLGSLQTNLTPSGSPNADFTLGITVKDDPFPALTAGLEAKLGLAGTNPFTNMPASNTKVTLLFNMGIDLSSVTGWLQNSVLQKISDKLQPIAPIINTVESVLHAPIPLLSSLNISGLPKRLEDLLPNGAVTQIDNFLTPLGEIVNLSNFLSSLTGGPIQLASYTLVDPPTNDPRVSGFDIASLVNSSNLTNTDLGQDASFLSQLSNLLPSDPSRPLAVPLLTDSLDDLKALVLSGTPNQPPVVLVQWTLPTVITPNLAGATLGPFYIVPPLAVKLNLDFGIEGGLTLGYDTLGFTSQWASDQERSQTNPVDAGIFLHDAHLALTGSVGLTAEADAQVVQVGVTGTITLGFGIGPIPPGGSTSAGLHFGTNDTPAPGQPPPTLSGAAQPFHTVTFNGAPEMVLQLGDFLYDLQNGGPLCPFNVGGVLSAGLSAFVTFGIDPFSITFTYDFGSITIAQFTIDTCKSAAIPHLVDTDLQVNDPTSQNPATLLAPGTVSAIEQQFEKEDSKFNSSNPATRDLVLLDVGAWASRRKNLPTDMGGEENVEVSAVPNKQTGQFSDLLVQGFGEAELIPNANNANTTILAFGDPSTSTAHNVKIMVEQGVLANAYLTGGAEVNNFDYEGSGDTYEKGGTAQNLTFVPPPPPPPPGAPPPGPPPGQNTLIGGSGVNYLEGGDVSSLPPTDSSHAAWNVLRGGPGFNTLQGGTAGATLYAGPNDGDTLTAGNPTFFGTSYILVAGTGHDHLVGGGANAFNTFEWNEKDGSVDVTGGSNTQFLAGLGGGPAGNVFEISAATPDETWHISQAAGAITIPVPNTTPQHTITARGIQVLSLDDSPAIINPNAPPDFLFPPGTNIIYQVDDLSGTGIKLINLNLHEQGNPDAYNDQVTINAPAVPATVNIDWEGHAPDAVTPVQDALTHVAISTQQNGPNPPVSYEVTTAVPKPNDTLTVNALGGSNVVNIFGTQPDVNGGTTGAQVFVNTGGGNNQITVGGSQTFVNELRTFVGLDALLGPLYIDAGSGHNKITFDESVSFLTDTVTLTATQVIRYTTFGFPGGKVTLPDGRMEIVPPEIAYPLIINYKATGGDFFNGVFFNTSGGSTKLYLPETGAAAPTTVNSYGGANGANDHIVIGYDGAFPQGQTQVSIRGINLTSNFPTTIAGSVLTFLHSPVTVLRGISGIFPALEVDDEAAVAGVTYVLGVQPSPPLGVLQRSSVPPIFYDQDTNLTLNPGNQGNTFKLQAVLASSTATINTGNGSNSITVGAPTGAGFRLDNIQGMLTIIAGSGTNPVLLGDDQASAGETYTLLAVSLRRSGAGQINFHKVTSVELDEAATQNNTTFVQTTTMGVPYTVKAGSGTNSFTLGDSSQSVAAIQGPLTLHGSGTKNSLTINDSGAAGSPNTYILNPSTFSRAGAALVTFDPMANISLSVDASSAAVNTTDIEGTAAGTSLTILSGSSQNNITAGGSQNDLNSLGGTLSVTGGSLILNDQGFTSAGGYGIDATSVSGRVSVTYSSLSSLTLNTGSGANTISVIATGAATTINGGPGTDTFTVGGTNMILHGPIVAGIRNSLTLSGGTGSTLTLNDTGNTTYLDDVKLTPTSVTSLHFSGLPTGFFGTGGSLTYSGISTMTLNASPVHFTVPPPGTVFVPAGVYGDAVNVTPQAGMTLTFIINCTLVNGRPGNALTVSTANGGVTIHPGTTAGSGFYSFTADTTNFPVVKYTGINTPSPAGWLVTAPDAGHSPEVKVFNAQSGVLKFDITAFDPSFQGGVRVAVGDVNGDGIPDIIAAEGPSDGSNGDSLVHVYDGITGKPLAGPLGSFDPFPGFHGGLYVASADLNGDGFADVVVAEDAGGQPRVRVYSGQDGSLRDDFLAFDPGFSGGVRVAAADVNGDGIPDIVAAAGPGGRPDVEVFEGRDLAHGITKPTLSFHAYDPKFTGGVYVATGDVHGDGVPKIITGEGAGGEPLVKVFDGKTGNELQHFLAFDKGFRGGVRVAAADVNGDGRSDIVAAEGTGGVPRVRGFDGVSLGQVDEFFAYEQRFHDGVFVAGGGRWGIFNPAAAEPGGHSPMPLNSPAGTPPTPPLVNQGSASETGFFSGPIKNPVSEAETGLQSLAAGIPQPATELRPMVSGSTPISKSRAVLNSKDGFREAIDRLFDQFQKRI
jgi:hypothetical protein